MLELDVIWGAFLQEVHSADLTNLEVSDRVVHSIAFAYDNLCICDDSSEMVQVHLLINCVLRKIFDLNSSKPHCEAIDSFLTLCIKLIKRLSVPAAQKTTLDHEDFSDKVCSMLIQNLINGKIEVLVADPFSVAKILISSAKMITCQANQVIEFSEPSKTKIEIFTKSSILLLILMEKFHVICGHNFDFCFDSWFEKLLIELENCSNVDAIESFLIQIAEFSSYWNESQGKVRDSLIGKTLPLLWKKLNAEHIDKERICSLIAKVCHILPNESDIFFAQLLSTAIRGSNFEVIEHFTHFWDFSVTSQYLNDVSLRISVLILVDSMTKDDFKFRKCSTSWIFSISKYLDRFLVPAISSFIDILECGINDASNSVLSSKKCFRKKFDKGPLIYYINIIQRLLEVNYEDVLNYLTITEVDPYLMIQMCAFVEMIKKQLNIDFDLDLSKSYTNFYHIYIF